MENAECGFNENSPISRTSVEMVLGSTSTSLATDEKKLM